MTITKTTAYHDVSKTVLAVLKKDTKLAEIWNGLTDIQRNEWCCYAETGKREETRAEHLRRLESDMKAGKKTPCCWPGCPHRRPMAAKWFGKKEK